MIRVTSMCHGLMRILSSYLVTRGGLDVALGRLLTMKRNVFGESDVFIIGEIAVLSRFLQQMLNIVIIFEVFPRQPSTERTAFTSN